MKTKKGFWSLIERSKEVPGSQGLCVLGAGGAGWMGWGGVGMEGFGGVRVL